MESNYPLGVNDKNIDELRGETSPNLPIEINVRVVNTLVKDVDITTENYKEGKVTTYDFSESDLEKDYMSQHCTIIELLEYLKAYVYEDMKSATSEWERIKYENIYKDCCGWKEDLLEIEP